MTTINSNILTLFSSATTQTGSTNGIIDVSSTLYGQSSSTSQQSSISLYNYYQSADKALKTQSDSSGSVKSAVSYFKDKIDSVTSVDQIFSDQKLYSFVTTALGLTSVAQSEQGLVKKALTGYVVDPTTYKDLIKQGLFDSSGRPTNADSQKTLIDEGYLDPKNPTRVSLANQLDDTALVNGALQLKFATTGLSTIQSQSTIDQLVAQYQKNSYETSISEQNDTVAKARYFTSNASSVTSVYQLLADKNFRTVVSTAYGIPQEIVNQSVDAQAGYFNARVNVAQLTDSKYVQHLVQRYLINADQSSSTGSTSSASIALSLLQNS